METFSIRQMMELTGLSEFTIRGWENRYSAFAPRRTDTGRRMYSKADIEKALLLRELLKRDHKIGNVAALPVSKLKCMFEEAEQDQDSRPLERSKEITRLIELVALQKWTELELTFKKVPKKDPNKLIGTFFLPLIRALSEEVELGRVSISQEHIFSSFLKETIYGALMAQTQKSGTSKARFILAAPEGDFHEVGLLLAHLLIRSFGFTSLYLGPHTPARELAETSLRFSATHVMIVATASKENGAKQDSLAYLSEFQKSAGSNMEILMAGRQAPKAQQPKSKLHILQDFNALKTYLEER
jgi:MerR family transcriptional regulator, light-induced transcriptional regulator